MKYEILARIFRSGDIELIVLENSLLAGCKLELFFQNGFWKCKTCQLDAFGMQFSDLNDAGKYSRLNYTI